MQMRTAGLLGFLLFECCLVFSWAADHKPPVFVFGGRQVYVGMSQREAVVALSYCCVLSPPVDAEKGPPSRYQPGGMAGGHFILSQKESPQDIFGAIFFSGGKVVRVTRPLAKEVDTSNEDVVGFARAIKRSLPADSDTETTTVVVSVRHEHGSNAESEVVSFSFPGGRGIELRIGTLDKPDNMGKRDFVTLDEILE
jgi:hypothetical protein